MASSAATLGLSTTNYAPAFLGFHFIFAYGVLSSRTLKQYYGLDHNESPREDLAKYGDAAVKSGKITQKQLNMLRRNESAHANAVENYAFFASALCMAVFSGVDVKFVNRAGLVYTAARIAYGFVYILIEHRTWSQLRGITWWIGNISSLSLLWASYNKLNGA
ncbi:hypothetical protein GQ53DRAFT_752395 [Thozetella sp. PMI_491]|nr:hypothetical protein GQ53DRAFT_752395 [Thozetella sp. PMI_491]